MKQYRYKLSLWDLIGLCIAVIFFFVGCYFATKHSLGVNEVRSVSFGADFYTDIYAAVRTLNSNLTILVNRLQLVQNAVGVLVMAASAFAAVKFGVYAYTAVTDKQRGAMDAAEVDFCR